MSRRDKAKIMEENRKKGKAGEEIGDIRLGIFEGATATIERTGIGHDRKVTKPNIFSGEIEESYHEFKTGDAKLSERQKESKRKLGKKFVEDRIDVPEFMSKDWW